MASLAEPRKQTNIDACGNQHVITFGSSPPTEKMSESTASRKHWHNNYACQNQNMAALGPWFARWPCSGCVSASCRRHYIHGRGGAKLKCVSIIITEGKTTHMNGPTYRAMINAHASKWIQSCFPHGGAPQRLHLVQDHERCLWQAESVRMLRRHHLDPLQNYPRSSPDMNLIETVASFETRARRFCPREHRRTIRFSSTLKRPCSQP